MATPRLTDFRDAKEMGCGGCGEHHFRLFQDGNSKLLAECVRCNSVSIIQPSVAILEIGWTEGSDGLLAVTP